MSAQPFDVDALIRAASESAAPTRRAALLAFAAGVLGLADPRSAGAKKRNKRRRKNKKGKKLAARQCRGQVGQCFDFATAFCPGSGQPQQCQENADNCCPLFGECDITQFLTCLLAES